MVVLALIGIAMKHALLICLMILAAAFGACAHKPLPSDVAGTVTEEADAPAPGITLSSWLYDLEDDYRLGQALEPVLEGLSRRERRALGRIAIAELEQMPTLYRPAFYAALARATDARGAADAMLAYLNRVQVGERSAVFHIPEHSKQFNDIIHSLMAVRDRRIVEVLVDLVESETTAPPVRCAALIALGQVGTQEAVTAFERIRDEAYMLPRAPQPQESYTHAERMAETLRMTTYVIPFRDWKIVDAPSRLHTDRATVDEARQTGELTVSESDCSTPYYFERFGDEWLVVGNGHTLCS